MPKADRVGDIFSQAPTKRGMLMLEVSKMGKVAIAIVVLILFSSGGGVFAGQSDILVSPLPARHEVRYVSGGAVYDEEFLNGRLMGRSWGTLSTKSALNQGWNDEAFEIRVKDVPTPPTMPGKLLSSGWKWVSGIELPKTDRGARHYVVTISSAILPIVVKVHTLLDGTPVLTRYLEITNNSGKSVALTELSPWAGRLWSVDAPVTLGHSLRSQQFWEGWYGWTRLSPGTNTVEEKRGLAADDPYFVLHNESTGEYFFGQLAWSANYLMEFQNTLGLTYKIGPTAVNALRVIAAGETITTPAVHLGYVKGDFDASVQAMHEHIRRSVLPARKPARSYLSQYLIPEDWPITVYRGDEYNETNMKKSIDVAAAAGIEEFVLDGPMWMSTYGDWLVTNQERFPHGLAPLVDYAHRKGLLFGLYAETEGGRDGATSTDSNATVRPYKDSKVFQEHPDWFLQPGSVLNLANPAAAVYFRSELDQIIDRYKLDTYRHDFNAPFRGQGHETLRDGFVESDYWRYYEAFYNTFRQVHEKYPDLILQQAANGGDRTELATAGVFYEQFTSGRATMTWEYRMLAGMSVYMPPETLVNSNGMALPDMPKGRPDIDPSIQEINHPDLDTTLRGTYALANTPMIFNSLLPKSVEELTPEIRGKFLHYSEIYKTFIRPLISTCKVYHHAPVNANGGVESGDWLAMEFASPDRRKGWATIIRLSKNEPNTYRFTPKSLDGAKEYRITFDNTGTVAAYGGAQLMRDGVTIQLPPGRESELLLWEAQ